MTICVRFTMAHSDYIGRPLLSLNIWRLFYLAPWPVCNEHALFILTEERCLAPNHSSLHSSTFPLPLVSLHFPPPYPSSLRSFIPLSLHHLFTYLPLPLFPFLSSSLRSFLLLLFPSSPPFLLSSKCLVGWRFFSSPFWQWTFFCV